MTDAPPWWTGTGNLWDAFRRSLRLNASRIALDSGERSWTFEDVGRATGGVARRLAAAGVGPGDRVGLLLANGPAFVVADLAVMARGAAKTPLSTMLSPGEVSGAVQRLRLACVVADLTVTALRAQLPDDVVVVELPGDPHDLDPDELAQGAELPATHDLGPDEVAAVYLSGGTTGVPKGIVHSQRGVLANLWAHLVDAGIHRDDRLLLTTPLAHSAGLFTLTALLRGARTRLEPGFDVERVTGLVDADGTTWTYGVPTMVHRLVEHADRAGWRPTTLRTVQYGSAPMSPGLLVRAFALLGPVLQQLYAQTECPQYATLLTKEDHLRAVDEPRLLSSAGRPTLMCEVSVRDDDGAELAPGGTGEVCLRSPYLMTGYWDDPQGYAARFHGSWLRTGDVGFLDDDGYLFLVDRRGDVVISGGMNVYCIEVENALSRHPVVGQSAVIGVPHPEWGEAVHAVVVLRDGVDPVAAQEVLAAHCRTELATYKRPKTYEVVTDLPVTRFGKVDKKQLRASHWAGRDRAVN